MFEVAIEPMVIPRRYSRAAGELQFFVAFHFPLRDEANNIVPQPKVAGFSPTLPDCLTNGDKPWPQFIREVFESDRVHFELYDGDIRKLETTDLTIYRTQDLFAADWTTTKANELWRRLVLPATVAQHAGEIDEHFISLLDDDNNPVQNQEVALLRNSSVDPWAASDLRPGVRLESFDSRLAARALASQATTPHGTANSIPHTASLAGLQRIQQMGELEQRQFLNFAIERNPELYRVVSNVLASYTDPRFLESLAKKLTKEGKNDFIEKMKTTDDVESVYQDYLLSLGQTEFRREQRFIQSSRHRFVEGVNPTAVSSSRRADQDQFISTAASNEPEPTTFRDIVGMAGQHPGLARRLSLVLYLGAKVPEEFADIANGGVRVSIDAEKAPTSSPFVIPAPITACEVMVGDRAAESVFRPRPKEKQNFLEKPAETLDPREAWRRYHVLPSKFYEVSQDDYTLPAGRAEMGVVDTPADANVGNQGVAAEDPLQHQTPAVNIYFRPTVEDAREATVSEDLKHKLIQKNKQLNAYNKNARQLLVAFNAQQSPIQFASFRADEPKSPKYFAEDLIVGHTVFARVKSDTGNAWQSLCRRLVRLVIKPTKEFGEYALEFEEEGAIASSVVVAAAPIVGRVTKIETTTVVTHDPNQTDTNSEQNIITVTLVQSENTIGESQRFSIPDEYLASVEINDNVLLSPSITPNTYSIEATGDSVTPVDAVEVYPVLKAVQLDAENVWQDDFELEALVKNALKDLTSPRIFSSRGDSRKNEVVPVRVAPFATRFLSDTGQYIKPEGELNGQELRGAPQQKPLLVKEFKRYLVEGERRQYGWLTHYEETETTRSAFATLQQPQLLSVGSKNSGPFLIADPADPGVLVKFGETSTAQLTSVRGVVQRVEFELIVPLVTATQAGADLISAAREKDEGVEAVPESYWKFVNPLSLPAGVTFPKQSKTPTFPVPTGQGYVLVTLRGVLANEVWQVVDVVVLAHGASAPAEAPATQLTWRTPIQLQTGAVVTINYPEDATRANNVDRSRQIHPLQSAGQLVDATVSLMGAEPIGADWPHLPFAAYVAASRLVVFPDGTLLKEVAPKGAAKITEGEFGFYKISAVGAKQYNIEGNNDPSPARIFGRITEVKPAGKNRAGIDIVLQDSTGRVFMIFEPQVDIVVEVPAPNSKAKASYRMVRDLLPGEFLAAACSADPTMPGLLRFVHRKENVIIQAVTYLSGELVTPKTAIAQATAEGTVSHRKCQLKTEAGNSIAIWTNVPYSSQARRVLLHSAVVLDARTVTQFSEPTVPAAAEPKSKPPLHATVSELLARWSGWSLTTPMPGNADETPDEGEIDKAPFTIDSARPSLTFGTGLPHSPHYPSNTDSWKLPALRFGKKYDICVRRSDLAGNHFYDEPLPVDLSTQGAFRPLDSITGATRSGANPNAFTRTDVPAPPVVAFPSSHREAKYVEIAKSAEPPRDIQRPVNSHLQVDPKIAAQFTVLEYPERERELLLLTDVLEGHATLTDDAQLALLPPPCPVETVMLHGSYDRRTASEVAYSIRWHEAHLEDRVLGLYASHSFLNYFPDPCVPEVAIQLGIHRERAAADSAISLSGSPIQASFFFPRKWPRVQCILLQLGKSMRASRNYEPPFPITKPGELVKMATGHPPIVRLDLPPGAMGRATARPADATPDASSVRRWPGVRLVHATNGAWRKPVWKELIELPATASLQPGTAKRKLQGALEIDPATTGSYSIQACWNEPWDESLPAQHEPAQAILEVEDGKPVRCRVTNPGFGFGTRTAILFENLHPEKNPVFQLTLYCGMLSTIGVRHAGVGLKADLSMIISMPAFDRFSQYRPARAVAHVNAAGRVESVTILDHGCCLGVDPNQLTLTSLSIGYPNLTPVLVNGQVDSIKINPSDSDAAVNRTHYSGDLKLRVIRRPPFYRPAQAKIETWNNRGGIGAIRMTNPGGFYGVTPIVVAHDPIGDGYGATLRAVSDLCGGIRRVDVLDAGRCYSKETVLAFYTNSEQFQEVEVADSIPSTATGMVDVSFEHSLSLEQARLVDYTSVLSSRFRKYVLDEKQGVSTISELAEAEDQVRVRRHVPRISAPHKVPTRSSAQPLSPKVDYLLPAFDWESSCGDLETAQSWFQTQAEGQITIKRLELVRVYLHRPWFKSGLNEQLAVVIEPATLHSTHQPYNDQNLDPGDGGAYNQAANAQAAEEPQAINDPLKYHAYSPVTRKFISRWGFDPVWREAAFPPLSVNHFRALGADNLYKSKERLSEIAGPQLQKLVQLAAHDVRYDAAKERWYADVRVDLGLEEKHLNSLPFVQLALAAFQSDGAPNTRLSPVVQTDMYKLMGDRTLNVRRKQEGEFFIELKGQFEHAPTEAFAVARPSPEREAVVKLKTRELDLPREIVEISSSHNDDAGSRLIKEFPLKWIEASHKYASKISLPLDLFVCHNEPAMVAMTVQEYEIFPVADDHIGPRDVMVTIDGKLCTKRLVYSTSFDIGKQRPKK